MLNPINELLLNKMDNSRISGMSRQTLTGGVKELDGAGGVMPEGRNRRPGGGRKSVRETPSGNTRYA
jgi:hypothetical protein